MKDKTSMILNIDNDKFAIGLDWLEISKSENVKNIKRREAKKRGINTVDFETEANRLIGFAENNLVGCISLAAATALFDRESLYVYKIESIDRYWVNYVAPDGRFGADMNDVIVDAAELIEIINQLVMIISSGEKLKVYSTEESIESIQLEIDPESEEEVDLFTNRILIQILNFEQIISGKVGGLTTIKKEQAKSGFSPVAAISGLASLLFISGVIYLLTTESEEYESLINAEYSADVTKKQRDFERKFKSTEEKMFEQHENYSSNKELIDRVDSNIYSLSEIIKYIEFLSINFPTYLVEWENKNIEFVKNENLVSSFKIPYTRINNSFGVYRELKQEIDKISKDINLKSVVINPSDIGRTALIVDVKFKKDYEFEKSKSLAEIKKDVAEETKKTDREIKKLSDEIKTIEYDAEEIGLFSRKIGSSIHDMIDDISVKSRKINTLLNNKEKEFKALFKVDDIKIPDSYYDLDRDSFLTMTQKNTHFNWKINGTPKTIPEIQNNSKDDVKVVAKVWEFEVSPVVDGSKGLSGLRTLLELINKKSITIKSIKYNFSNEQWSLNGEFYEKN